MSTDYLPHARANSFRKLAILVLLLMVQFALRTHNTTIQGAFVDEGLHDQRASIVWHLDINPGQNSHGKLLVYYWLGLFVGGPLTILHVTRNAIALISLVTAAAVYLLGRLVHSHHMGIVALFLYTILPLAVFHERMALADPLASVFSCLIAWRSLVFARRPSRREGAVLGCLLALGTMAKLTLFMLPLLVVMLSFLYMPSVPGRVVHQLRTWIRIYFVPLTIAALTVALLWAPILIPAYLARNSAAPFKLVDQVNLGASGYGAATVLDFLSSFVQTTLDFTGPGTLVWIVFCIAFLLFVALQKGAIGSRIIYLIAWLALLVYPLIALASFPVARYAVPEAAPLVLISALTLVSLWDARQLQPALRLATIGLVTLWVATFALPFDYLTITAPDQLALSGANQTLYLSQGVASVDASVRSTIAWLDSNQNDPTPVYSDWRLCALIYMYTAHPLNCLDSDASQVASLSTLLGSSVKPGQTAYFLVSGFDPDWPAAPDLCPALVERQNRGPNITLDLWRVQPGSCLLF